MRAGTAYVAERRFPDGNEMARAVSAVRLGQRPPQPRTGMLQAAAPAPTPTASTAMLGKVAHPRTVVPTSARVNATNSTGTWDGGTGRGSGVGIGLFIAALLAVIIGGIIYAGATGLLFPTGDSEETTTPETITETFTPQSSAPAHTLVPPVTQPTTGAGEPGPTEQESEPETVRPTRPTRPTTQEEEPTPPRPPATTSVPTIVPSAPATTVIVPTMSMPVAEPADPPNDLTEGGGLP